MALEYKYLLIAVSMRAACPCSCSSQQKDIGDTSEKVGQRLRNQKDAYIKDIYALHYPHAYRELFRKSLGKFKTIPNL